jgi:hypothetical protein
MIGNFEPGCFWRSLRMGELIAEAFACNLRAVTDEATGCSG